MRYAARPSVGCGQDEGLELKRAAAACLVCCLALLAGAPVAAAEMEAPAITLTKVDWDAAAAGLAEPGTALGEAFAKLNKMSEKRFSGIGKSTVPVLLPFDLDAFAKDDGKPDAATSDQYFGGFHPNKFFLAGPAGYDATFEIKPGELGLNFRHTKPAVIEISGAAFTYDLDGPDHQEVFPPKKELAELFPGMKRILREANVRYVFERFGVPYVLSIQCFDMRPSKKHLSCREADLIAEKFLRLLKVAGGTPAAIEQPRFSLGRPEKQSPDFTYHSPGDLIENSGWKKLPGRADYHVYSADMRFPIANAPGYVISQSFMPWGDCYRKGTVGRMGRKGAPYRCKVNDKPLVFDESSPQNFNYPWRDNFCENRDYLVGQCPGGYGHQGQDIRPSNCVLFNAQADRCMPYQHTVAAVHDGMIRRTAGNIGAYIVVNTAAERVRFRYLHMNPKMMDAEGLLNGQKVSAGEIIGKVATWGDFENGTSYHINFNIQVFTKVGWVWVNPYMSLVAAYERLIGGRGKEIMAGEAVPPPPDKPPVILNPDPVTSALSPQVRVPEPPPPIAREKRAAENAKVHKVQKRRHHRRIRRKHRED
jgi:murein DD-endopeptidase MepM/ murein hydrolase activator NlpD